MNIGSGSFAEVEVKGCNFRRLLIEIWIIELD
jgi:hypothetical protein